MVDSAVDVEDERTIRVFILDDHELVRRGLTDLLCSTDDMKVVGEAANARETWASSPTATPTGRSASASFLLRRPSRTTSRRSWPSSACNAAPKLRYMVRARKGRPTSDGN